jgi:hypothetical protein
VLHLGGLELTLFRRRDCRILSFLFSRTDDRLPAAVLPPRRSPSEEEEEDEPAVSSS